MPYVVKNNSRGPIHEDLDTVGANGKRETLHLKVRESKQLSNEQYNSRSVQKHVREGRLRASQV